MRISMQRDRKLTISLLILIGLTLWGTTRSAGRQPQDDINELRRATIRDLKVEDIKLTNETSAFLIESIEKTPQGHIKIKLRNGYDKIITAYRLSIGNTTATTENLDNPNNIGIQPGEVIEHIEAIEVDPYLSKKGIIIQAVVFEDGSNDGTWKVIKEINEYRRGQLLQIELAQELLQQVSFSTDNDLSEKLEAVKAKLQSGYNLANQGLSESARFGFSDTGRRITLYIDNVKQMEGDRGIRQGLERLVKYCETKATKFRMYQQLLRNKQKTQ